MKNIEKLLSSYTTTIVLLVLYAIGLGGATFIEKYFDTLAAKNLVYYSPLFFLLQFLLVVNFVAVCFRYKLFARKKWGMLVVHFSFVVILLGAFVSHLFGEEGVMHLREGEKSKQMMVYTSAGTYARSLPFEVELLKFTLTRYPGSSSPSSYESELRLYVDGEIREARVYMNNVLDLKGYRFFQASYDTDEKGTILSVNRDVAGRSITYVGYCCLLIGFILCFTGRHSRFRQLARRLKALRSEVRIILFMVLAGINLFGAEAKKVPNPVLDAVQRYAIDPAHAEKFGILAVQSSNGRVQPMNTFSSEILRKLHKAATIGNMNSDQFLISLWALPDMWMRVPFIVVSNEELTEAFGLSKDEIAYVEAFDHTGKYKLQDRLEEAYHKMPAERTSFDKDLMKLDEKINIVRQLLDLQLVRLFPKKEAADQTWYTAGDELSVFAGEDYPFVARIIPWYIGEVQAAMQAGDWSEADELVGMIASYQQKRTTLQDLNPRRIQMEIRYNRLNIFAKAKKGYLILGGLLLVFSFITMFRKRRWLTVVTQVLSLAVGLVFLFHLGGMVMRGYISGYAPWSNAYETMVYVAWATVLAGILFARRSPLTFALATLFGGVILFVSGLNWMDPQINPLMPVLKSPWLMFHVAVIVAAYGFFGISCLIGLTNQGMMLGLKEKNRAFLSLRIKELTLINEMSLWIGLALMTIGTFLGAVWANESWGRYWGWDPKETWALITMVVYAITLHLRLIKRWDNVWLFNLMSVLSFASVLMTYFGVNYFLSGMHSYGQNDSVNHLFMYLYIAAGVVFFLAIFSYIRCKKRFTAGSSASTNNPI
ncbi:cytochrome c-type biogenesis protein CcsB [Parabacteroides sp. PFB2-10]|uniref:cytochrome c biogenesis protein CcsA n=1 Tax=Parabacteroides sp. PFB2-10 TaxID=1742405 RepID=UPI0024768EFF|nr:cytochrome c biogenesis protein CcsA [Parabacteroides sp. PFB2-10]MDH6312706.1 cytochrome c-type biogenesis protein CcsB [Parabacteroides sp. PFB2-10]